MYDAHRVVGSRVVELRFEKGVGGESSEHIPMAVSRLFTKLQEFQVFMPNAEHLYANFIINSCNSFLVLGDVCGTPPNPSRKFFLEGGRG